MWGMKRFLSILLLATATLNAEDKPPHPINGAWVGHEITESGEPMEQERVRGFEMSFQGAEVSVRMGEQNATGKIELDDTKSPKWINITLGEGKDVMTIPAIYEVAGDTLRLCHPDGEGERPKKFVAAKGFVLGIFKRPRNKKDGAESKAPEPLGTE